MSLVTSKEMFKKSIKEGFAIGAFNINNMEFVPMLQDLNQFHNMLLSFY